MNCRSIACSLTAVALVTLAPAGASAQTEASEAPRTAWGAPDLQGVWDFRSLTPMERPEELADDESFSPEQAAEFAAETIRSRSRDADTSDRVVPYNDFWFDEGTAVTTERTSLIVDPPDGRIPALTEEAQERQAALAEARSAVSSHEPTPGGFVEDLGPGGLQVRCILGFNSGPPMAPSAYNNNVQVFQTEDTVVLLAEMNHEARVVPLDGRDHLTDSVRQWTGDSRGRWDGDTLVVEVTNFNGRTWFDRAGNFHSDALRVVERYTPLSPWHLQYEATIEDPNVFTRPWTISMPLYRRLEADMQLLEYKCVEFVEQLMYGELGIVDPATGRRNE